MPLTWRTPGRFAPASSSHQGDRTRLTLKQSLDGASFMHVAELCLEEMSIYCVQSVRVSRQIQMRAVSNKGKPASHRV